MVGGHLKTQALEGMIMYSAYKVQKKKRRGTSVYARKSQSFNEQREIFQALPYHGTINSLTENSQSVTFVVSAIYANKKKKKKKKKKNRVSDASLASID
jgi:hypothetical protein